MPPVQHGGFDAQDDARSRMELEEQLKQKKEMLERMAADVRALKRQLGQVSLSPSHSSESEASPPIPI
jgi:uncharacterized coiled-coil protein SlyX